MSDEHPVVLHWESSPFAARSLPLEGISYGHAGGIRAFALVASGRKVALRSYLPTSNGKPVKDEEFPSREKAKERANEILKSFVTGLFGTRTTKQRAS
ncbi:hypothetical protein FAF44_42345 [Nonomuraea sp. MG754425]|uniref:hypothetical protein n=1 Tax=Nonomuraea sp. MG754425 TaxID=2570319 RepID=UPI001F1A3A27|nr:hypothetical protein [Nonomuraea sp. MG754425]MCF6474968.1 hypothetical protein [Nonomuraea sp. MG754425]